MGKNLKGRECGKGIYQRKDGYYSARYYAKSGKREEKYLKRCRRLRIGLLMQNTKIGTT